MSSRTPTKSIRWEDAVDRLIDICQVFVTTPMDPKVGAVENYQNAQKIIGDAVTQVAFSLRFTSLERRH